MLSMLEFLAFLSCSCSLPSEQSQAGRLRTKEGWGMGNAPEAGLINIPNLTWTL